MRRRRALAIVTAVAAVVGTIGVASPAATAAPGSSTADTPHYVQLGDSYSAGNGGGSYAERTCFRSPNNYGARVAQREGATYTNAACSGGVTADILNPRELGSAKWATKTYRVPKGAVDARAQWLEQAKAASLCGTPAQQDWSYDYAVSSSASLGGLYTATVRCQLTAAPQIDAVTPKTDAVFLTMGGNDLAFTDIATTCLFLRAAGSCASVMEEAHAGVPEMKQQLKESLRAVHQRSGGTADVYLLGYPYLINTASHRLSPTYDFGADLDRLQRRGDAVARTGMAELNREVTGEGDFTFVDVKTDWGGRAHGLDPWVLSSHSDAWLVPIFGAGNEYSEWVHPSPAGWGASALALYAAMS